MAKKQSSFNAAAGFFEKPLERAEPTMVAPAELKTVQKAPAAPKPISEAVPIPKKVEKAVEGRRSFSFFIGDDLDARLLQYVTKQKLQKRKVTKTDVICAALEEYLNRHDVGSFE